MSKCRLTALKAKVTVEAVSGRETIQKMAANHAIRLSRVSRRKKQLMEGASELFARGKKTKDQEDGQAREAKLFQQYHLPEDSRLRPSSVCRGWRCMRLDILAQR